jgi:hypothetical protein
MRAVPIFLVAQMNQGRGRGALRPNRLDQRRLRRQADRPRGVRIEGRGAAAQDQVLPHALQGFDGEGPGLHAGAARQPLCGGQHGVLAAQAQGQPRQRRQHVNRHATPNS